MKKEIKVVQESKSGLNQKFQIKETGEIVNRGDMNRRIKAGEFPDYHVAKINNHNVPRSNPDKSKKNNLG